MSIFVLYLAAIVGGTVIIARLLTPIFTWKLEESKRKKHRRKRRGDISEALRQELRFFDDQYDPREWRL